MKNFLTGKTEMRIHLFLLVYIFLYVFLIGISNADTPQTEQSNIFHIQDKVKNLFLFNGLCEMNAQDGEEEEFIFPGISSSWKRVMEIRTTLRLQSSFLELGIRYDHLEPYYYVDRLSDRKVEYSGFRKRYFEFELIDALHEVFNEKSGIGRIAESIDKAGWGMKFRGGNIYKVYARGMGLNLYEDPGVNVDREIDGFAFDFYNPYFEGSMLAGTGSYHSFESLDKPLPQELKTPNTWKDVWEIGHYDELSGFDLGFWPMKLIRGMNNNSFSGLKIGGGYVKTEDIKGNKNKRPFGYFYFPYSHGDLYLARALNKYNDSDSNGKGLYLDTNFFLGNFTFHGEYKYYHFQEFYWPEILGNGVPYVEPTLAKPFHEWTLLSRYQYEINKNDEVGNALELTYNLQYSNSVTAGYAITSKIRPDRNFADTDIKYSPFYELYLKGAFNIRDNYRLLLLRHYRNDKSGVRTTEENAHCVEASITFKKINTFKFTFEHQRTFQDLENIKFWDFIASLTYLQAPWFSAGVTWERTNELEKLYEIGYTVPPPGAPLREDFASGNIEIYLSPKIRFNVVAGNEQGGLVCHGGICEQRNPFKGVRTGLSINF